MKTKELSIFLEEMEKEFRELSARGEIYTYKILEEIESFQFSILEDGKVRIYYDNAISSMIILVEENEELYVFAIMILYTNLSYQIKKASRKTKSKETKKQLEKWNNKLARIIRKLATKNIIPRKKEEEFCNKVQKLMEVACSGLHHKVDQIGKISNDFNLKESKELKSIRSIYEKVNFQRDEMTYYDYPIKRYETIQYTDSKFLYAILNIYAEAYIKTIFWLKKEDPMGQWCPLTPWQVLQSYKMLLENYFFYSSKM